MEPAESLNEALKREWTDKYVEVNSEQAELRRFEGLVGRVVTVNCNNKALVDFADGGWYDITASEQCLRVLDPAAAKEKYDAAANSAQPHPSKQG
jgi:ribosomal protein L28